MLDFLLTMSAPGGVDYIDLNLNEHLDLSIEAQAENEECSMTGLLFEIFSQTGNATWVSFRRFVTGSPKLG